MSWSGEPRPRAARVRGRSLEPARPRRPSWSRRPSRGRRPSRNHGCGRTDGPDRPDRPNRPNRTDRTVRRGRSLEPDVRQFVGLVPSGCSRGKPVRRASRATATETALPAPLDASDEGRGADRSAPRSMSSAHRPVSSPGPDRDRGHDAATPAILAKKGKARRSGPSVGSRSSGWLFAYSASTATPSGNGPAPMMKLGLVPSRFAREIEQQSPAQ